MLYPHIRCGRKVWVRNSATDNKWITGVIKSRLGHSYTIAVPPYADTDYVNADRREMHVQHIWWSPNGTGGT